MKVGRYKIKKSGRPKGYVKPLEQLIRETMTRLENRKKKEIPLYKGG